MEEKKPATEANVQPIATGEQVVKVTVEDEDLEQKVAKLEEEKANYQAAYLKERAKNHEDETDEDKFRRIAREELQNSHILDLENQKERLLQKALKENRELKLAVKNKTDIPVSTTVHSEGQAVRDTLITPEQMAHFKAMGKSDKWIENYKKNLVKNTR